MTEELKFLALLSLPLCKMSTSKLLPGKSLLDIILGDWELAQMEGSVWADLESQL